MYVPCTFNPTPVSVRKLRDLQNKVHDEENKYLFENYELNAPHCPQLRPKIGEGGWGGGEGVRRIVLLKSDRLICYLDGFC